MVFLACNGKEEALISVIIPVYNRPKLVKRAINSVLNQTFKEYEIIVIDDGSTDETSKVLESFGDKIITLRQNNSGVSSARNLGIKSASYPMIAFLDSDDEWSERKLEIQMEFHKHNPHIKFSHTNELWIKDQKVIQQKKQHKKPSGFCFNDNLNFCKIGPSTVMITKELFGKIGYFDESLKVCEDYDMWLRILDRYEVGLIDDVLTTKYAEDDQQLSFKYHSMDRQRVQALLKHKKKDIVVEEIIKKISVLKKGAIKHQNSDVIVFCEEILLLL